jgi:hypothetical protein
MALLEELAAPNLDDVMARPEEFTTIRQLVEESFRMGPE